MRSELHTFPYPNGEHQRVQLVRLDSWEQLEQLRPVPSDRALQCFGDIYENYLIPACPWVFGNLVMFRLPEELAPGLTAAWGQAADSLTAAAMLLRKHLHFAGKRAVIRDEETKRLWQALEQRDCLRIVRGKLPITTIIPVANTSGFLTESEPRAALKVNGSFFIMDPFDCATEFDHVGTCFGLYVKNGVVERPPLYSREALLVGREGKPMLLWAEGAAKLGHTPGADSCGATLADMARICSELGMVNAINLDGGGSAQLLLHNRRSLQISDRSPTDHTESERPVPMGLIVQ